MKQGRKLAMISQAAKAVKKAQRTAEEAAVEGEQDEVKKVAKRVAKAGDQIESGSTVDRVGAMRQQ